jgi:hypothetical protein
MPKVRLDGACVLTIRSQLETAPVPQHVAVDEGQTGRRTARSYSSFLVNSPFMISLLELQQLARKNAGITKGVSSRHTFVRSGLSAITGRLAPSCLYSIP